MTSHVQTKSLTLIDHFAPLFEIRIHYLGSVLSAYALSGEPSLLRHAEGLGQIILPAYPVHRLDHLSGSTSPQSASG